MNIDKSLDLLIKAAETNQEHNANGYLLNNRTYENYIDNATWIDFVAEMKKQYPVAFSAYGEGAGDELGIKKVGKYPPKMASYGSSSRMIYLLSRNIPDFYFEEKLPTTVGGIAHLDGYLCKGKTKIFVEAKCREPYSSKSYIIDRKYEGLYRYIDDNPNVDLKCNITVIDDEKMNVKFIAKGMEITRFDIKQMISHLLGIATQQLQQEFEEKICFLYLLYNPRVLEIEDEKVKNKIYDIYNTEISECDNIPFASLYGVILNYLRTFKIENDNLNLDTCVRMFTFNRCDQNTYLDEINGVNDKIDLDIEFVSELLRNLPSSLYNPTVFVSNGRKLLDDLVNECIAEIRESSFSIVEINDINDMKNVVWNEQMILIIRDIQRYESYVHFSDEFVKLFDIAKSKGTQMIITTDRSARNLDFDNRVYARLQSGVIAEIVNND